MTSPLVLTHQFSCYKPDTLLLPDSNNEIEDLREQLFT